MKAMVEQDDMTKKALRESYLKVARTGVAAIRKRLVEGKPIDDVEEWLAAYVEGCVEGITLKARLHAGKQADESLPLEGLQVERVAYGRVKFNNMRLEPCPFCGSEAVFQEMKNEVASYIEHRVCVQCETCLARTRMRSWKLEKLPESRDQLPDAVRLSAIAAWNKRPAPADA